jgi:citrate synthase
MVINEPSWFTAITEVQPNRLRLRGYPLDELIGQVSFSQAIHLTLLGELPSPEVGAILDAILVAAIDHGVTPPSTLAARTAASTGAPLSGAVAAGVLSINQHHGGAIEGCMQLLKEALRDYSELPDELDGVACSTIDRWRFAKRRLPGLGHRIHTADPRVMRLFELAKDLGVSSDGVTMLKAIEVNLREKSGRDRPINVDGAIAALLVDTGLPSDLANGLFIIARLGGLVAHVNEESRRGKPSRKIDPDNHHYDGPEARSLVSSSDY